MRSRYNKDDKAKRAVIPLLDQPNSNESLVLILAQVYLDKVAGLNQVLVVPGAVAISPVTRL
jgi:hypothetical protein